MSSNDGTDENKENIGRRVFYFFEKIYKVGRVVSKALIRVHEFVHSLVEQICQRALQVTDEVVATVARFAVKIFSGVHLELCFALRIRIQIRYLKAAFREHSYVDMIVNLFRTQERGVNKNLNGDIVNNQGFIVA